MAQPNNERIYGVYIKSILNKKIVLSITEVGSNTKKILEEKITSSVEGKCIAEGFIRPGSVRVLSYSSPIVHGDNVEIHTVFECMICHPVEGMKIECISKDITKAGIHAQVIDTNDVIPVTVFIARDHHNTDKYFNTIKANMEIVVKVIGMRYELNDPYICVIGELIEKKMVQVKKPKLKVGGDSELII
jgi:DNA-directed RNA polymerase subunit E'/Rpb7